MAGASIDYTRVALDGQPPFMWTYVVL
jgi:hypothetical protein